MGENSKKCKFSLGMGAHAQSPSKDEETEILGKSELHSKNISIWEKSEKENWGYATSRYRGRENSIESQMERNPEETQTPHLRGFRKWQQGHLQATEERQLQKLTYVLLDESNHLTGDLNQVNCPPQYQHPHYHPNPEARFKEVTGRADSIQTTPAPAPF